MTTKPMIDTDRHRLAKALSSACHDAKREMPAVGNDEHPTPWDLQHRYLNKLLDDLERTRLAHPSRDTTAEGH